MDEIESTRFFQIGIFLELVFLKTKRVKEVRAIVFLTKCLCAFSMIDLDLDKIDPSFARSFLSHWITGSLSFYTKMLQV